jgi:hypothetical protein
VHKSRDTKSSGSYPGRENETGREWSCCWDIANVTSNVIKAVQCIYMARLLIFFNSKAEIEEFEDTKRVTRIRISKKNRQRNVGDRLV